MRLLLAAYALFLLAAVTPARAQDCSQAHLHQLSGQVTTSQQKLLDIAVEEMNTDVPPAAQLELPAFKNALAVTVDAYMQCVPQAAQSDIKQLEAGLAALLGANKPDTPVSPPSVAAGSEAQVYGADFKVAAEQLAGRSDLIGIKLNFDIACGVDTVLLVYEPRDKQWQRTLRWQSELYTEVSGAFGDYVNYVLLPQGAQGGWVLAAVHGNPWCTSVWSAFGLDVIAPARDAVQQRSLFHLQSGYNRGDELGLPTMKPTADGFELRVATGTMDPDHVFTRPEIFRYRVSGSDVRRIQPVAVNGRDFVDEWLQRPWTESREWTSAAHLADLEKQHDKVIADFNDVSHPVQYAYGPVRACSDHPHRFQLELDREEDGGPPTYFAISEGQNSFTMLSASPSPDPHCTGPDLMRPAPPNKPR